MKFKIILKKKFVLTLEDNARTSLRHGMRHYLRYIRLKSNRNDLKFAIIHVFHAIELYLKARLVKESPLLIYTHPEDKITEDTHTVQFKPLLNRLENAGVDLSLHKDSLIRLQVIRNRIEHHQLNSTVPEIKDYIAKAARFLNDFLATELKIKLEDIVNAANYVVLKKLIYSYDERMKSALEEIRLRFPCNKAELESLIYICPECKNKTMAYTEDDKTYCYFCCENIKCVTCLYCGAPTSGGGEDIYCDNCRDHINDQLAAR